METVAGSADLATATVAAIRGDHDRVAPLLALVHTTVDTSEYRGFAARIRHAAGLAALAQGSYLAAYAQLGHLFAADGTPLHYHFSYLAIADLAAAAVRAERHLEARTRVERAARGSRTACLRRHRPSAAADPRCAGRAHRAAARDRHPRRARPDQRRDRRPAVPVPAHRRLAPAPLVRQARDRQSPPAPWPHRPRRNATGERLAIPPKRRGRAIAVMLWIPPAPGLR
jgi:hypothetical protein